MRLQGSGLSPQHKNQVVNESLQFNQIARYVLSLLCILVAVAVWLTICSLHCTLVRYHVSLRCDEFDFSTIYFSRIGRDLSLTCAQMERLAELAKKKSLFSESGEVETLSRDIKQVCRLSLIV